MENIGTIIVFGLVVFLLGGLIFLAIRHREKLSRFYHEVVIEMGKTSWPTRDEVINSTVLVLVGIIISTLFLWGVDLVIGHVVGLMFA